MLTDEVYNQYLYVQQQAQQREKEKQQRQEELKKQQQEQAKQDEQLFAEKCPNWLPPSGRDGR